ncbi:MAG: aldehyde ferredoxin oxidoreductase C-terminal domain-containing protein [Candidatus Thorarchaeota archaeon]|jgi:aldehyde:ferredoxin oxidoreductase
MMTETRFRMLEVDLTGGKTKVVDVTDDIRNHLGARGLASKIFWDRMPEGADPLGPENMLHVGIGPVTALIGDKTIFSFKSPLFGWKGRASMSGYLGRELVNSPFNGGILITGVSERPVILCVLDHEIQIKDASKHWGEFKQRSEYSIRKELREEAGEEFAVAVIGPAGENFVRYANVTHEWFHSASKWGVGAVMGSKGLKAIAVRGRSGPDYADHSRVWENFKQYVEHPAVKAHNYRERRFGHMTSMPNLYYAGGEGVKNNNLGWHEVCDKSNAFKHELEYYLWTEGCPGCANPCFVPFYNPTKPYGPVAGEFRHDNTGCFNANIMVGYQEMSYITTLLDELGMDGEETGGIVAWAMELYERGIITKEELGGIDLRWGSVEATDRLMRKIAYREDLGDILADGYKYAIPAIGKKSEKYAWQVHWCSCATYDMRRMPSHAVDYACSHNGARMGTGLRSALSESATVCNFTASPVRSVWGSLQEGIRRYVNAVCGWNITLEDLNEIVVRNYMLERCYCMREGYNPTIHTRIPDRAFEQPITNKLGETYILDREDFADMVKEYNVNALQLTEDGYPRRELLKKLNLDYVLPTLDRLNDTQ